MPKQLKKFLKTCLDNNIKIIYRTTLFKIFSFNRKYISEKNIKVFALTNNTNLAKKGIWTFGIDPQQQTKTILDFIISKGNKNIGFLLPDNSYGYLLYDTIEKVFKQK